MTRSFALTDFLLNRILGNLKKNDVNSDRLAMLFKLNSESIFLTGEITNEGNFN